MFTFNIMTVSILNLSIDTKLSIKFFNVLLHHGSHKSKGLTERPGKRKSWQLDSLESFVSEFEHRFSDENTTLWDSPNHLIPRYHHFLDPQKLKPLPKYVLTMSYCHNLLKPEYKNKFGPSKKEDRLSNGDISERWINESGVFAA